MSGTNELQYRRICGNGQTLTTTFLNQFGCSGLFRLRKIVWIFVEKYQLHSKRIYNSPDDFLIKLAYDFPSETLRVPKIENSSQRHSRIEIVPSRGEKVCQ